MIECFQHLMKLKDSQVSKLGYKAWINLTGPAK